MWDEQEISTSLRSYLLAQDQVSEELLSAVECDDLETVTRLSKGFTVGKLNDLLLFSSWKEALEVTNFLLTRRASPNTADGVGRSCLHLAAINGNLDMMKTLLGKGARVDAFDKHHLATPLFCSAVSDNPEGINLLLQRGANINAGLHEYGVSALHCAVRANNVDNVRMLLELGANPNNVQLFSETPLHTAASMGFEECVKLLIHHGACLEVLMGSMKMTALHLAAQDGNTDSVQYLLDGGANIDARNARGQSALHLAALAQSPETVEVLIKAGKREKTMKKKSAHQRVSVSSPPALYCILTFLSPTHSFFLSLYSFSLSLSPLTHAHAEGLKQRCLYNSRDVSSLLSPVLLLSPLTQPMLQ